MQITKKIETETGHRLTNYAGKCAHLHGHRYQWEVTVSAEHLDETGFVMDYGDLKAFLISTIDQLDHAMLLHTDDPLVRMCASIADVKKMLGATNGMAPRLFLLPFNPTTENLLKWQAGKIMALLKATGKTRFTLEHIRVYETSSSFGDWYKSDPVILF